MDSIISAPTYKVVEDYSTEGLEAQVNLLLRQGWQLQGSVSVVVYRRNTSVNRFSFQVNESVYVQAMVRFDDQPTVDS